MSSSSSSDASKNHSIDSTQKLKNAESAVRELLKLSKKIPRAERALAERKSLLKELAEAKSLLAHQKQTRSQIITDIENRYATWMEEKSFTEREMQKKIAHVSKGKDQEIIMLKSDLESSMRSLQLKERECEDSAFRLSGVEEHLRRAQKELERLKADIGFEDIDAPKLSKDFESLSVALHILDDLFVKLERSRFMKASQQPIPFSNSRSSKLLRAAAAESVIAHKLSTKIFRRQTLPGLNNVDVLDDKRENLFTKNPKQEVILRSMIATSWSAELQECETQLNNNLVGEVAEILTPLFRKREEEKAFCDELLPLLKEASRLWGRLQRCSDKLEVSVEGDANWDYREDYGEMAQLQEGSLDASPHVFTVLFPRIMLSSLPQPLHPGYVVWSDQACVVEGISEFRTQLARVRSHPGHVRSGRRRASGGTSAHAISTSPIISKSGIQAGSLSNHKTEHPRA